MKLRHLLPFCFLNIFLCFSSVAQVSVQQENPETEAEIKELVHELFESLRLKDLEKQKSFHLYSEDFTAFYGGQKRKDALGAQEYEENLLHSLSEDVQFDIEDLEVNVFENTAVASFHIYVNSTVAGEKKQSQARITLVYVKVNGDWKIIHEHVSPLTVARQE